MFKDISPQTPHRGGRIVAQRDKVWLTHLGSLDYNPAGSMLSHTFKQADPQAGCILGSCAMHIRFLICLKVHGPIGMHLFFVRFTFGGKLVMVSNTSKITSTTCWLLVSTCSFSSDATMNLTLERSAGIKLPCALGANYFDGTNVLRPSTVPNLGSSSYFLFQIGAGLFGRKSSQSMCRTFPQQR
jgi:hypothetical protein